MTVWTRHGGRLEAARAAYGEIEDGWIDLSTGINPVCWPGVDGVAIDWCTLPDPRALADLESAAAAVFGCAPALVCAVPGTEIGLRLLADLLPGPAAHVAPTYRTHAEIFGTPIAPDALPTSDASTVILANPNNPDGRVFAPVQLPIDRAGWLIVDEAFADTLPDASAAGAVRAGRRLVVLRSFGKMFGLAGVRLGFVIAPPDLVARLRRRLGDWPLSSAAIAIGTAAYRDRGWIAAARAWLPAQTAALDAVLARQGLHAIGACPLFRLVESDDAAMLFERLARRGILTRPFDYAPRWLRFGLPGDAATLARLDRAFGRG